ncbi:hypothetical protein FGB62_58g11 [Gracilaria domingensis]|nr:hypothetical protein FGB62_58g11 [Gracilaria domingensis]
MLASTFFRKSSQQEDVEREVSEAADSLSRLLQIADTRTNSHHARQDAAIDKTIDNAIRKLESLQHRLVRHKELVDLVEVFENEIAKKADEAKKRESELEQWIVEASMQRVTLLSQKDEIANQLAVMKRRLQERQAEENADREDEERSRRIAKLLEGNWDDVLDIDEDE